MGLFSAISKRPRKIDKDTWCITADVFLFLVNIGAIIDLYISISLASKLAAFVVTFILTVLDIAALYAVLIYRPMKRFDRDISAMRFALKIGSMEHMTEVQRRSNLCIKSGQPFDYYEWRDNTLIKYGYRAYDDFQLSFSPYNYDPFNASYEKAQAELKNVVSQLSPTKGEINFAEQIVSGVFDESYIPRSMDSNKIHNLVKCYKAVRYYELNPFEEHSENEDIAYD